MEGIGFSMVEHIADLAATIAAAAALAATLMGTSRGKQARVLVPVRARARQKR
jgi:hypothetical protein